MQVPRSGSQRVAPAPPEASTSRAPLVLLLAYALLALPYLLWRATVVNVDVWFGPLLYVAELYGILSTVLFLWMTRIITVPPHRPARLSSTVDAFICTFNEPLGVLCPTVRATCAVRGIRSVFVLDDGNREEVREMAESLGAVYLARSTNQHAKAGNLNFGLANSDAEFLLLLDADHVPSPQFLERTLGQLDDPRVAFVQTPQIYHNRDTFLFRLGRHAPWSEQGMFYDCIQPAKNRSDSAFFVGTSAVMRRAALDSIGGFATGTATEDIHTSLQLHARGWSSVFVPEALAFGLEAENLKEFYRQRRRWAAGSLGLLVRSADSPLRARGLTASQRLSYLSATLAHAQGLQRLIFVLTPLLCVLTLSAPVNGSLPSFFVIAGSYTLLGIYAIARYSRGTYHLLYTECYALANAVAQCAALTALIRVDRKFSVSRKSVARSESTWVKSLLQIVCAASALGAAAAVTRLALGAPSRATPLLIGAGLMLLLNFGLLTSFLLYLRRYERLPPLVVGSPLDEPGERDPVAISQHRADILSGPALAAPPGSSI